MPAMSRNFWDIYKHKRKWVFS